MNSFQFFFGQLIFYWSKQKVALMNINYSKGIFRYLKYTRENKFRYLKYTREKRK